MSILVEVLEEELSRLERQEIAYKNHLKEENRPEIREQLESSLLRVAEDRIRIQRALAPVASEDVNAMFKEGL